MLNDNPIRIRDRLKALVIDYLVVAAYLVLLLAHVGVIDGYFTGFAEGTV